MNGAWAECDRCGFRRRHNTCRIEWSGAFVCEPCFDPRPPWLDAPSIDPMEATPVANARFESVPVFLTDGDPVTGDDL